jgi:hypothetical protein
MKNFNPISCLEMLIASTSERAAIVKLWRYFCLTGFPNFSTPSSPPKKMTNKDIFLYHAGRRNSIPYP